MDYTVISNSILFCGIMEKRRDGVVRSGWSRRTFLLTSSAIYYYRRTNENEFLGAERGQILLSDIISVKALLEDQIAPELLEASSTEYYYLEIITKSKSFYMRVNIGEASSCESWCIAINEQRQNLERTNETEKGATLNRLPETILEDIPTIQCISVVGTTHLQRLRELKASSSGALETTGIWIVTHLPTWGKEIDLGILPQGGACILTMRDGGMGRIGTQALLSSWDTNQPCWIEVTGSKYKVEVEVVVQCQTTNKRPIQQRSISIEEEDKTASHHSPILMYTEVSAAFCFLLLCSLTHLLYDVTTLRSIYRACLTIGASLAVLTIFNDTGILTNSKDSKERRRIERPLSLPPQIQFFLTLRQCKITHEDKVYHYPIRQER